MRSRLATALLTVVLLAAPAAAQWRTVDTFVLKGAYGMIIIPENWNGGLFVYAHGYSADERLLRPFPPDLSLANFSQLDVLFQASVLPTLEGYASATTTFRSAGWYVKDAVKDIENVRRYFIRKYGRPTHTYLWGHSGGGMVTSAVIEYAPRAYDGALPMCGPGAGARRNFNGAFDLRVLYEYVCRDVPDARFTCRVCSGGDRRCLVDGDCPSDETCGAPETPPPPEDGLTAACTEFLLDHPDRFNENPTSPGGGFVERAVTACFGGDAPSPDQAARRDLFVRASQIPDSFVGTDLFFASIGMGEVVHRRNGGRHPWGNEGVAYDSPLLAADERAAINAGVHRVREDPEAVSYMRHWYEPRGRTRSKVLTIHALDDGLVLPENEVKYRQAFERAGTTDRLVQLYTDTGGHCGFISVLLPAIQALTAWVEDGITPSTAGMMAACPTCDLTERTPGPWGLKVVERPQASVRLRDLACSGLAGDCPTGSACWLDRHHCR